MRIRRAATLTVAAALAAAALPALAAAGQARAVAAPAGSGGPPPPGGGGTYAHAVYSHIQIAGGPGGQGMTINTGDYSGPPCWIEPRFTGGNSWQRGDPIALTPAGDADEYWWWFAGQEPGFAPNAHDPQAAKLINDSFKKVQRSGGNGWWWVPAWLAGSSGMACALGLVSSLGLNNGFLDFTPPAHPGDSNNAGPINPLILREMARAAIRLPAITVTTNPAPARGVVNLPIWVSVAYQGNRHPSETASVPLPDGTLMWATVTAHNPAVQVTASTSSVRLYNNCGATGNQYNGDPTAVPRCGATFLAPSSGGPFTLTVTVRWTVSWRDYLGRAGAFPPASRSQPQLVTVREIQAVNTPPPAP
jgi:hypothetical protein